MRELHVYVGFPYLGNTSREMRCVLPIGELLLDRGGSLLPLSICPAESRVSHELSATLECAHSAGMR